VRERETGQALGDGAVFTEEPGHKGRKSGTCRGIGAVGPRLDLVGKDERLENGGRRQAEELGDDRERRAARGRVGGRVIKGKQARQQRFAEESERVWALSEVRATRRVDDREGGGRGAAAAAADRP
jgi:hypothetical protein